MYIYILYIFVFGVGRWILFCSVIPLDTKKREMFHPTGCLRRDLATYLLDVSECFWLMLHHTSFAMWHELCLLHGITSSARGQEASENCIPEVWKNIKSKECPRNLGRESLQQHHLEGQRHMLNVSFKHVFGDLLFLSALQAHPGLKDKKGIELGPIRCICWWNCSVEQ